MSPEGYQSALEKLKRAKEGDEKAREEVIQDNLALVKFVLKRFSGCRAEYEDLYQYGCLGLVKAVDRFDPEYPVQFSTYAVPVIMGEIRRYLRDDGPIHVSRTIRERARQVEDCIQAFTLEHGRSPDAREIAEALSIDTEDVLLAINCKSRVRSLDEPVGEEDSARLMDVVCGEAPMETIDQRLTLSQLLRDLPGEERMLIVRRYFKSHTQEQIARDMGTSQVQVSRMESRILKRMRAMANGGPS